MGRCLHLAVTRSNVTAATVNRGYGDKPTPPIYAEGSHRKIPGA